MGTFYRQTLFAEYELIASRLKEQDKPINHQVLSNIMVELYQKYYGLKNTSLKFLIKLNLFYLLPTISIIYLPAMRL